MAFFYSVYDSTMTTNIIYLTDGIFCLIFHRYSLVTKMVYLANNVSDLNTNSDFGLPLWSRWELSSSLIVILLNCLGANNVANFLSLVRVVRYQRKSMFYCHLVR